MTAHGLGGGGSYYIGLKDPSGLSFTSLGQALSLQLGSSDNCSGGEPGEGGRLYEPKDLGRALREVAMRKLPDPILELVPEWYEHPNVYRRLAGLWSGSVPHGDPSDGRIMKFDFNVLPAPRGQAQCRIVARRSLLEWTAEFWELHADLGTCYGGLGAGLRGWGKCPWTGTPGCDYRLEKVSDRRLLVCLAWANGTLSFAAEKQ